uniref:DUF1574 domain-containing protein n=1 Tax=Parastrongyloides trichosuri TaxID=131310 RepID=A0A0N4ZWH0_PARTI
MEKNTLRIFIDIIVVISILSLIFNYSYWKITQFERSFMDKSKGFFPMGNSGKYMSNYIIWPGPNFLLCSDVPNTSNFFDLIFRNGINVTHDDIFSNSKYFNLKNALKNDVNSSEWTLILFTQNPLLRFLNNFIEYCGIYSKYSTESSSFCFLCHGDLSCFVTKLFDYLKDQNLVKDYYQPSLRDKLFVPQFWKCNLKIDNPNYSMIQTDNKSEFYTKLSEILTNVSLSFKRESQLYRRAQKIAIDQQKKINDSTWNFYEDLLTNNEYILTKFITMYFYDYYILSYQIPYF